jgi:hypothetical protein
LACSGRELDLGHSIPVATAGTKRGRPTPKRRRHDRNDGINIVANGSNGVVGLKQPVMVWLDLLSKVRRPLELSFEIYDEHQNNVLTLSRLS